MKIAILADLHLPDRTDTLNEEILGWALNTAATEQVQLIVSAGDMIQAGAVEAAKRLRAKLEAVGLPFLAATGNTELDTPEFQEIFTGEDFYRLEHGIVAVFDPSDVQSTQLKKLSAMRSESLMLVAHYPLETLEPAICEQVKELFRRPRGAIFVAGHEHLDREQKLGDGEAHIVRGLDPDKAIGAPPALHIFEYKPAFENWQRRDIAFSSGDSIFNTREERDEFAALLGISTMHNTLKGIDYATLRRIKCLEMRFEAIRELSLPQLSTAIQCWRKCGGEVLSLHFPDISWDSVNNTLAQNEVPTAFKLAAALKIDHLTVHIPRCSVALLAVPHVKAQFLDVFVRLANHAQACNISVGIENLHMRQGEKPDEHRGFGYTPDECIAWIRELRTLCRNSEIGLHFDIGHARNNAPYSSIFTIGQWYAAAGNLINGYHLHQVTAATDGTLKNHQPIKSVFGPLISYFSFFHAWRNGRITHAPIFIETDYGTEQSYETLCSCFQKSEMRYDK
ncbi:MAG: TIM barrel protein [Victivallales bacterium]